jgi:ketosteroid isomerase-like protein
MTDDITDFLDTWVDAERRADSGASDRLLTDDFVGVGPVGFQLTKQAWLQRLTTGGLRYDHLSLDELTTRVHGTCALVTARWNARGSAGGRPIPETVRATLAIVKDGDAWQLAGIHYSFIAGSPGSPPLPGATARPEVPA